MAKLAHSSLALDFLRRLLCAHSAADAAPAKRGATGADIAQHGGDAVLSPTPTGAEARSPCIVARLMGLDAMPAEARDVQRPLRRSRSASSAEGWSPPPPCFVDAPQPRVIRASASLREKPTYLRRENDEFLLLSFSPEGRHDHDDGEDDDDGADIAGRGKRRDRAKKQRRGRRRLQLCGDEEAESGPGRSRRPASAAECAGECGLQNSSPVSVLEARDGQEEESTTTTSSSLEEAETCSPCPEEIHPATPRQQQQASRRKLQPDFDDLGGDLSSPAAAGSSGGVSRCSDRERRNRRVVNKAEVITTDVAGIWQLICRLVEEDVSNMKWVARYDANIAAEMGSEILDQLICEATYELTRQLIKV